MTLYQWLLKQYGTNEPILSSEISFKDHSRSWIAKQLKTLRDEGKIIRYEKGIYYIPTDTLFGKSILNPIKVIERKYIKQNKETIGYYSGVAFQNKLKITNQVPNVIEVCTNNETANMRNITVGKQKVILRKARVKISNENAPVLSFLELMNNIKPETLDADKKKYIVEYMNANNITKKDIVSYSSAFPDRVMRNLIKSEAVFNVAQ